MQRYLELDIAASPKAPNQAAKLTGALLVFAGLCWAGYQLWVLSQAEQVISSDTLTFAQVHRGDFEVLVRGNGVLVPEHVQWLSVSVDTAKVEQVKVKPGMQVEKGDLIVELSNPQLLKRQAEQRWEIEAMQAEANAAQVAEESALLAQQAAVLDARLNYESNQLKFKAESQLMLENNGAVSRITYEQTELATRQLQQRWDISTQRLKKMRENLLAQNRARSARLQKAQRLLESLSQQVDDLQVVAGIDSIVLEVPVQAGQRLVAGANVAKLAQQDALIAELQVPELQIHSVAAGQSVLLDTRNSKLKGVVKRVDPSVVKGNVKVDVVLLDASPAEVRPDLSVFGEIKVTDIEDTLFVTRPLYAQSQSTGQFYKLSQDGNFAQRVELVLGHGSVDQIQVLAGLNDGDRILVSDPSQFERYEKFRIN